MKIRWLNYLFILLLGIFSLLISSWMTSVADIKDVIKLLLSDLGTAFVVAATSAYFLDKIFKGNTLENIDEIIAEKFPIEYSAEIVQQLLKRDLLRDYVKCNITITHTCDKSGLKVIVEYEFVTTNLSKRDQDVEIQYIFENRIIGRASLEAIEYRDLDAAGSRIWVAKGHQLVAFREIGAFGEKYAVIASVAPRGKLWAKTRSVELHPYNTELYLVCYQPSLEFAAHLAVDEELIKDIELSVEYLHPRLSSVRKPKAVKEDGKCVVYSYHIDHPCLPYQGVRIFTERPSGCG